jgi:hypothetical protein
MAKGKKIIDKEKDKSVISHPERYGGDTTYECIKVLEAWLPPDQYKGFLRGNALKYLCRVGKKDETVQELKKAKWYLEKLIECEEGEFSLRKNKKKL